MERIQQALNQIDEIAKDSTAHNSKGKFDSTHNAAYCPWSQTGLIQRIRSYHWSWTGRHKPADIITCARYGWVQGGTEDDPSYISCTVCKARLYLPWNEELLDQVSTLYIAISLQWLLTKRCSCLMLRKYHCWGAFWENLKDRTCHQYILSVELETSSGGSAIASLVHLGGGAPDVAREMPILCD